ncbi:MAG: hypothetical protein KC486_24050 [Myxococcales bacterium]|nr:hypothetical protein [Myxococcales bacterium]
MAAMTSSSTRPRTRQPAASTSSSATPTPARCSSRWTSRPPAATRSRAVSATATSSAAARPGTSTTTASTTSGSPPATRRRTSLSSARRARRDMRVRGRIAALVLGLTPAPLLVDCSAAVCGDGVVDGPEVCDDGNLDPYDGCNELCTHTGAVVWTYVEASPVDGYIGAHGLTVADDGAVFVAGEVSLEGELDRDDRDNRDVLLRKLSSTGEREWPIPMTDERLDAGDRALDVAVGDDGAAVVVGEFDGTLRGYTADGAEAWVTTVLGTDGSGSQAGQAIAALPDGSFAVVVDVPPLLRVDRDGRIIGEAAGAPEMTREYAYDVTLGADRLYVAGSDDPEDAGLTVWVAAYSMELDALWVTDVGPGYVGAVAYVDDGVLVAGHEEGADAGWLGRLSADDGALRWERGLDQERGQVIRDLAVDHRGDVVAVGEFSRPYMLAWIARLNSDGDELWSETIDIETDGSSSARAVALGPGGRLYLAGLATDAVGYHRLWAQAREP